MQTVLEIMLQLSLTIRASENLAFAEPARRAFSPRGILTAYILSKNV